MKEETLSFTNNILIVRIRMFILQNKICPFLNQVSCSYLHPFYKTHSFNLSVLCIRVVIFGTGPSNLYLTFIIFAR